MPASTTPAILLLCGNDASANLDRRALRNAGYQNISLLSSGSDAARMLAGIGVPPINADIVICCRNLPDMDGLQFCAIVRQHPGLKKLPILLLVSGNAEYEQLRIADCEASALLARPYSLDSLKKKIDFLAMAIPEHRDCWLDNLHADFDAFEEALDTYGILLRSERTPEEYFKLGMKLLGESQFGLAQAAFKKAMPGMGIKAEAEMGLAAAARGLGDIAAFRQWLASASETFVAEGRWNRARTAYAKLLQQDPAARNPFLAEAHRLIRTGNYNGAAHALLQGHNLIPKMKAGERYAGICLTAADPSAMFSALEKELDREGEREFLGDEIKKSLASMIQRKEEIRREQAQERTWKLARSMGVQQDARAAGAPDQEERPKQYAKTVKPSRDSKKIPIQPKATPWQEDAPEMPLMEFDPGLDAGDGLFQGKSLVSDFLSMVKLTWRLNKRAKKS